MVDTQIVLPDMATKFCAMPLVVASSFRGSIVACGILLYNVLYIPPWPWQNPAKVSPLPPSSSLSHLDALCPKLSALIESDGHRRHVGEKAI